MSTSILRRAGWTACLLLAVSLLASCSDDGDGSRTVVVPLEGAVREQMLVANEPNQLVFTLQLPPEYRNVLGVTLDAEGSARHVTVESVPGKALFRNSWKDIVRLLGGHGGTATIRVGDDPTTVCSQGILYGPFEVSHTTSAQVGPETVEADAPTLEIINAGMIAMCVTITPTIDVVFGIDSVDVQVTQGVCDSPGDFAGTWTGTYNCNNSCGDDFGGQITINVNQDGEVASYSDGEATFTGTVCGNHFRFERITAGEIERGTLTLDGPNEATKRSTWRSTSFPFCNGNCVDVLTRVPDLPE